MDHLLYAIAILFILCAVLLHCHRQHVLKKLCAMTFHEKCDLLNELVQPFGFYYCHLQQIFSSSVDAWQREFGYCALYDRSAAHFQMLIDCEPIYFDYDGRTWLIELWKGQYGITSGAEVGIYLADRLLLPEEYSRALFHCASDEEMLPCTMQLTQNGRPLFWLHRKHWWLTGFCVGAYARPEDLCLKCSITFQNLTMQQAFVHGLLCTGYTPRQFASHDLTVTVIFDKPLSSQPRRDYPITSARCALQNRLLCLFFRRLTRHQNTVEDKLLYLYFRLPFAFRRMLRLHPRKKRRFAR